MAKRKITPITSPHKKPFMCEGGGGDYQHPRVEMTYRQAQRGCPVEDCCAVIIENDRR